MAKSSESDAVSPHSARAPGERRRQAAVAILAIVATLFAVLNFDEVKVNLIFTSTRLPLVLVIVACLVVGYAIAALQSWRRGRGSG